MKRLIGFALLCIALGMFLIMVLPFAAWIEFAFIIGLSVLGYALFCKQYERGNKIKDKKRLNIMIDTGSFCSVSSKYLQLKIEVLKLSTFYTSGLQTRSTNVHFLGTAFCFNANRFYI